MTNSEGNGRGTTSLAVDIDAQHLPPILAALAREFDARSTAGERLKTLFDLFETVLRLVAGLAVGRIRARERTAPDELARILVSDLGRPTLDPWFNLARKSSALAPETGLLASLAADVDGLIPLMEEVSRARNKYGHGAVSEVWEEDRCRELRPKVAEAIRGLTWLSRVRLQLRLPEGGGIVLLDPAGELPVVASAERLLVEARVADESIALFPFVVVIPAGAGGRPHLGVLAGLGRKWEDVETYAMGLRVEEPKRLRPKPKKELSEFSAWCRRPERMEILGLLRNYEKELASTPPMFGREGQLERICTSVESHPITLVEGGAGTGKTLLAAHAAQRLRQGRWRVVYWRFVLGDARAGQLPFLKYLEERLRESFVADDRDREREPRLGDDPRAWKREVSRILDGAAGRIDQTVVVLDGLDECADESIVDALVQFGQGELRWLCTGRASEQLRAALPAGRYFRPFEGGLERMTLEAVEEWVRNEVPDLAPKAKEVARSSDGLAQYVRLFLDEVRAGRSLDAPLPTSLSEFWKEAITRASSRSPEVSSIFLKVLLCAGLSAEALTVSMIRQLLVRMGDLVGSLDGSDEVLLGRALLDASSLLVAENVETGVRYRASHSTLVELLGSEPGYRNTREACKRGWLGLLQTPVGTEGDARVRAEMRMLGVRQLLVLEMLEDAVRLFRDFGWVRDQLFDGESTAAAGERRLRGVLADADRLLEGSPSDHEIRDLRRFIATQLMALPEAREEVFFQGCANGEAGHVWRDRAKAWCAMTGVRRPWLELVAVSGDNVQRHMTVEIPVQRPVKSMAFEPDGEHLLVSHHEGDATRYRIASAGAIGTVPGLRANLLGFDPAGNLWSHGEQRLELWKQQAHGGYALGATSELHGIVHAAWPDDDAGLLLSVQDDHSARLLRARDQQILVQSPVKRGERVAHLSRETRLEGQGGGFFFAVSGELRVPYDVVSFVVDPASGTVVGVPLFSNTVVARDLMTLAVRKEVPCEGDLSKRAAGPVRGMIAIALNTGDLQVIDLTSGSTALLRSMASSVMAIDPSASRIATVGVAGVQVWDALGLLGVGVVPERPPPVMRIAMCRGSERVACLREDGKIEWYDFNSGKSLEVSRFCAKRVQTDRSAVSLDGRRMAAPGSFGGVEILDVESGRRFTLWEDLDATRIDFLALSWDGRALDVFLRDGPSSSWDVESGQVLEHWQNEPIGRHYSAEDVDHYRNGAEAWSRRVWIRDWDNPPDSEVGQTFGQACWWSTNPISAVGVAQDGRVAVATADGVVVFLRYRTGVGPQLVAPTL